MSSGWLLGLSHHIWWQYFVLVFTVTPGLCLRYTMMQLGLRWLQRSFVKFPMYIVRKQDHEGWQTIAINLGKKIKYTILNFNHSLYLKKNKFYWIVDRPTQVCSSWFRLKLPEILTFACMTNLRPIRSTQKLPEYRDCLFTLQTDEPCKRDEGTFCSLCTRAHFSHAMSLYQS